MTRTRDADVRGFSAREIGYLSKLPAVEHVTRGRIVYAEDFKNHCVRRYLSGDSPAQIFRMAGLDSSLIGYKRIERCIARWKDTYGHDERVLGAVNDDDRFDAPRDKRWVPPVGVELPEADSSGHTTRSVPMPWITRCRGAPRSGIRAATKASTS